MQPLIPYFTPVTLTIPLPDALGGGPLILHGFGLSVGIGIMLGAFLMRRYLRSIGRFDQRVYLELVLAVVFGVFVGGHLGYVLFYDPARYIADPPSLLDLHTGMSSFGGFIVALLAVRWVLWRRGLPFWPHADAIAYGLAIGWMCGRIGCTLNFEHPGTPSKFWLARYCRPVEGATIEWPAWMSRPPSDLRLPPCDATGTPVRSFADQVATDAPVILAAHDMGFYEVLYSGALFLAFLILRRFPRRDGTLVLLMLFSYMPVRFAMDFLRPLEGNPLYAGLTPAQWGCIGFLVVGSVAWSRWRTTQPTTLTDASRLTGPVRHP